MPLSGTKVHGLNSLGFMKYWDSLKLSVHMSFSVCRVIAFVNQALIEQHVQNLITDTKIFTKAPTP